VVGGGVKICVLHLDFWVAWKHRGHHSKSFFLDDITIKVGILFFLLPFSCSEKKLLDRNSFSFLLLTYAARYVYRVTQALAVLLAGLSV
jgi:hypothetical protein